MWVSAAVFAALVVGAATLWVKPWDRFGSDAASEQESIGLPALSDDRLESRPDPMEVDEALSLASMVVAADYPRFANDAPSVSTWAQPGGGELQVVRYDAQVPLADGSLLYQELHVLIDPETQAYRVLESDGGSSPSGTDEPFGEQIALDLGETYDGTLRIDSPNDLNPDFGYTAIYDVFLPPGAELYADISNSHGNCAMDVSIEVDGNIVGTGSLLESDDQATWSTPATAVVPGGSARVVIYADSAYCILEYGPLWDEPDDYPLWIWLHLEVRGAPPPSTTTTPTTPPSTTTTPTTLPSTTTTPTTPPSTTTVAPVLTTTPAPTITEPIIRAIDDIAATTTTVPRSGLDETGGFNFLVLTDISRLNTELGGTGSWDDVWELVERRWGAEYDVVVMDFGTGEFIQSGRVIARLAPPTALTDLDRYRAITLEIANASRWQYNTVIIGGAQVVPFGRVPNPTIDSTHPPSAPIELTVATDLWYGDHSLTSLGERTIIDATHNAEQILPESEITRVPDGNDFALIEAIFDQPDVPARAGTSGYPDYSSTHRTYVQSHEFRPYLESVRRYLGRLFPPPDPEVVLTPPESPASDPSQANADISFFTLHGRVKTDTWTGEREEIVIGPTTTSSGGSGFTPIEIKRDKSPVAFTTVEARTASSPGIVFANVCYGAYIEHNPDVADSIALTQLRYGAFGFIGSTRVAFSPPVRKPPDTLAPIVDVNVGLYLYTLARIEQGHHPSTALHLAREDFIVESARRPGQLDNFDVKAVLATVYYGLPDVPIGRASRTQRPDMWSVDVTENTAISAPIESSSVNLYVGDTLTSLRVDEYGFADIARGTVFHDSVGWAQVDLAPNEAVVLTEHHSSSSKWPGNWLRVQFADDTVSVEVGNNAGSRGILRQFPSFDGVLALIPRDLDLAGIGGEISGAYLGGLGAIPRPDYSTSPDQWPLHRVVPLDLDGPWQGSNGATYYFDPADKTWLRYQWTTDSGEVGYVTSAGDRLYATWGSGNLGEQASGTVTGYDVWDRPTQITWGNDVTFGQGLPPPAEAVWWD